VVGDLYGSDTTQVSSRGPRTNSMAQTPPFGNVRQRPPNFFLPAQPRPPFPSNLPAHPQAYVPSVPVPAHIVASSPTVSPIPYGSQPGSPQSTMSPVKTVFVPQNRQSLAPSDSISNLFYDHAGVDREIEKLHAMAAGRNTVSRK
jgi:hypothetical protein